MKIISYTLQNAKYKNILKMIKQILKQKIFLTGLIIIITIILIASLADILAPYPPLKLVGNTFNPPSLNFYLGTDDMGRDIYSMIIYGSRTSLIIGITAAIFTTLLGTIIGIFSGVFRGILDTLLMRSIDFLLSLPYLVVALVLVAFLQPNIGIIILIIVILSWIPTAKVVRSKALSIMESGFVEAAISIGASRIHIALKHVLPSTLPIIISSLILSIRDAILFESTLSFLGFGDPTYISWGTILFFARRGAAFVAGAWWCVIPPGFMIMLTVLGFTLMSMGLDEILNPRLRQK